ncbi:MAG: hypothetical protein R6U19_06255 [Bacteroidales bacterium]
MKLVRFLLLAFIVTTALAVASCDKEEDDDANDQEQEPQWEMFVYGNPGCGYCTSFMSDCDAEELDYTFYDVTDDNEKNQEMWDKVNEAGMGGGSIGYPIVDVEVDGEMNLFERPSIEEVLEVIP